MTPRPDQIDAATLGDDEGESPVRIIGDDHRHEGHLIDHQIDWETLYEGKTDTAEWLVEPLFATGRAHAMYAPAKAGKSLLLLAVCAALATGRTILGRPAGEGVPVIYCDYEMTEGDVLDRLLDMGYDDPAELEHLHYVLMADMPALDTDIGGRFLADEAKELKAALVAIDTTGRAVTGPENDADTYLDFYRHTGRRLKAAGVTWVRLDHAGKNIERGQRGSSAKNDDVDVVWQLTRPTPEAAEFNLVATHRRMSWIPSRVEMRLVGGYTDEVDEPLVFRLPAPTWPAGTKAKADELDFYGVPLDATVRGAQAHLRKRKVRPGNTNILTAALRWRRHLADAETRSETPSEAD